VQHKVLRSSSIITNKTPNFHIGIQEINKNKHIFDDDDNNSKERSQKSSSNLMANPI
jgi:hypothetical protein